MLHIVGGNLRLLTQAARIQEINGLASITPEIIAMAQESPVIGTQSSKWAKYRAEISADQG